MPLRFASYLLLSPRDCSSFFGGPSFLLRSFSAVRLPAPILEPLVFKKVPSVVHLFSALRATRGCPPLLRDDNVIEVGAVWVRDFVQELNAIKFRWI